jgi:FkbM family methyltransferase
MYSQLEQDLWILEATNFKINGYFVDVGAYDGIFHSNTYLLEKKYGWSGICVEPSSKFNELKKNRSCLVDNSFIYDDSMTTIQFAEINYNMELSGCVSDFKDSHDRKFDHMKNKEISTLSLTDLCINYNSPNIIDYLSIDTEGSELKILKTHNFNRFRFNYISIEHNRNIEYKNDIEKFLNSKGYIQDVSQRYLKNQNDDNRNFEDWYVFTKE